MITTILFWIVKKKKKNLVTHFLTCLFFSPYRRANRLNKISLEYEQMQQMNQLYRNEMIQFDIELCYESK